MPFQFDSRVRYSEMGLDKRLTLVSLVDYFQDCSTFQSEDYGVGIEVLKEKSRAWMVLSWQIEILRRPVLGRRSWHRDGRMHLKHFWLSQFYS